MKRFSLCLRGALFFVASFTFAANMFDITFPIPELGNCENQRACKVYCDDLANVEACLDFAEVHGFVRKEDSVKAKKLSEKSGPGGCRGEACKTYCEDESHFNECISFAEREGFMSHDEALQARKFRNQARQEGETSGLKAGPGNCQGREACKAYCEDPDHRDECLDFAGEHHLMSPEDIARARKHFDVAKKGGPGGCKGENVCREYCQNPEHAEECLNFAVENGFMSKEEAERAKKFQHASADGGPGGCKGEACRDFCEKPENQKACFEFAKKHDLISEAEQHHFEAGQKLQQHVQENGGPGGCRDEESCRRYCSNPAHTEECITFAATKGGVTPDEARKMLEEFRKVGGRPENGIAGDFPATIPAGPGGCVTPEECIQYCSDPSHREECAKFGPKTGGEPPGEIFKQVIPGSERDFQGLTGEVPEAPLFTGPTYEPNTNLVCDPGWEVAKDNVGRIYCAIIDCHADPQIPKGKQFDIKKDKFGRNVCVPKTQLNKSGPGGCTSPEACKAYCMEHEDECKKFLQQHQQRPQASFMPKPQDGSGQFYPPRPSFDPQKYPMPSGSFTPKPHPGEYPPYQPQPEDGLKYQGYPSPYPGMPLPPAGGTYPPPTYPEGQTVQPPYPQGGASPPSPPPTAGEYYKGNLLQAVLQYFWRVFLHPPL